MNETNEHQPNTQESLPEFPTWVALMLLGLITLTMFTDALFVGGNMVLSNNSTDVSLFFLHWRKFGFAELSHGHLALWNPYLYSGEPFFGGFQAALLYPLNVVFMLMPVAPAVNWSIALHVYLAGAFAYLWVRGRDVHSLASLFSAMMFMFGGPYFLHIFAGHLPNLCTMVWAPLLFLAIDRIFARPAAWGGCLLGIFAVAMAVLAGHPQYVFYMGMAAGLYVPLNFAGAAERRKITSRLALIVLGAAGLTAIQLFTGLAETRESVRSAALPYSFAASFSFPPENFLTMVAPWFFGRCAEPPYWGRCLLFEASLFVGVTGLALAVYGAIRGTGPIRRNALILLAFSLLLALGSHTPLFRILYDYAPEFDRFRGLAKFSFLAALFLSLLAGIGLDRLIKQRDRVKPFILGLLAGGTLLAAAALVFHQVTSSGWAEILRRILLTGDIFGHKGVTNPEIYLDPNFIAQAGRGAWRSFLPGAGLCLVLALLLFLTRSSRHWLYAIVLLGGAELFIFARSSVTMFDQRQTINQRFALQLARQPGDYRVLNEINNNCGMTLGVGDIWGDDPSCQLRYGQFMVATQGKETEETAQGIRVKNDHPIFDMLRRKYILEIENGHILCHSLPNPLPKLLLIEHYRLLTNRAAIFSALLTNTFNPREEVILESSPAPEPKPAKDHGTVQLVDESTDEMMIQANLSSPALLLITDSYNRHWKVLAGPGAPQSHYDILPANYCLRAIPLAAGHHHFRLEYIPPGFQIGKWISAISLVLYVAFLGWFIRQNLGAFAQWPVNFKIVAGLAVALFLTLGLAILIVERQPVPLSARKLLQNAAEDYRAGRWTEAADECARVLSLQPDDADTHNNLAAVLIQLGRKDEALQHCYEAVRLRPDFPEAQSALGYLLAKQEGKETEASEHLGRAVALDPTLTQAQNLLGGYALSHRKWSEAANHFFLALQGDQDNAEAHDGLGRALFGLEKNAEAAAQFLLTLKISPHSASAHYYLGNCLLAQKKLAEAAAHFQAALEVQPSLATAHFQLAMIASEQKDYAEAIRCYREAIRLNPNWADALNNLAWMLATCPDARFRHGEEAVRLAEHSVKLSPETDFSRLDTLAVSYAEAGKFDQAIATAQKAHDLAAKNSPAQAADLAKRLKLYQARQPYHEQ